MSDETGRPVGVFAGLSTLDVIQLVERLPRSDEKVAALDVRLAAGGPAANAAVAFAGLGGAATLLTRISHDAVGDLVVADLAACGVRVVNAAGAGDATTTVASIMVTAATGERAVVSAVDRGRSAALDRAGADLFEAALIGNMAASVTIQQIGRTGTATQEDILGAFKYFKAREL